MRGPWGIVGACALTAGIWGGCIASPVVPPPAAPIRYPITQGARPSGLRLVAETAPDFGVAGVVLVVGCGSADEGASKAGLAHLVEHLVFRSRRGGSTFERKLDAIGAGAYNAMTSWDETTYFAFGPDRALPALVDLLASVLDDPLAGVDDADFEHERQIVREELHSRAENGTPGQVFGLLAAAVFPDDHPYAHPVVGTEESIARLTLADAREFARAHYHPEASVLTVTGPSPTEAHEALIAQVESAHRWPPGRAAFSARRTDGVPTSEPQRDPIRRDLPVATPALWLGWSIPARTAPEADIAALVARMVDSVFWRHVYDHDRDIAYVEAEVEPGAEASLFYVKATLKEGTDPRASGDSLVQTMLHGLSEETYVDQSFQFYKSTAATALVASEEPITSRALHLAESMQTTGVPTFLRSRAERTALLSSGAVGDFYRRYLVRDRARRVFVRPVSGGRPSASPMNASSGPRVARSQDEPLAPPSASDTRSWMREPGVASAKHATLDNGLEVVVLPRRGSPFHSVVLAYHGGHDSEGVPGAAVASLWAKEHFRVSAGAWGVEYRDRTERDVTTEFLRATGSDLRFTLQQLRREGEFRIFWPPQTFSNLLKAFEREDASPDSVFQRGMEKALYGDHPYGRQTTAAALRAVRPNDVYGFLDRIHRADNALLVVVGDVDPSAAIEAVRSELGSFGRGSAGTSLPQVPVLERAAAQPGDRLVVQDRPGSDDVTMRFSCVLPKVEPASVPAAWLFANAVDAVFHGELRERTASSYGVTSRINVLRGGTAVLELHADVNPLHLPFAVQAVRRFVERPADQLFDERLLGLGRAMAACSYNLGYGTTEQVALRIASMWNLGWPIETYDRYPETVSSVTVGQIVPLAEHCRQNWVVGWLGDEPRIREALGDWRP